MVVESAASSGSRVKLNIKRSPVFQKPNEIKTNRSEHGQSRTLVQLLKALYIPWKCTSRGVVGASRRSTSQRSFTRHSSKEKHGDKRPLKIPHETSCQRVLDRSHTWVFKKSSCRVFWEISTDIKKSPTVFLSYWREKGQNQHNTPRTWKYIYIWSYIYKMSFI